MAIGAAVAAKHGEQDGSDPSSASNDMLENMKQNELEELACTDREDLPERVDSDD